ncbi:MAG: hypothetical protein GF344_03105 [Chitinivibrionales bacterium]|nr:hypothetical protein [Chitinivibrionales bacterium]MBD3356067.1 hypothetical protein [Chitinivibrionales bacterium]
MYIDDAIQAGAEETLRLSRSSLSPLLSRAGSKVALSLESKHGCLFDTSDGMAEHLPSELGGGILDELSPTEEGEELVLMHMANKCWRFVSCVALADIRIFPAATLPVPETQDRSLRYEMLALLDCFSLRCREIFEGFHRELMQHATSDLEGANRGAAEERILAHIASFSRKVDTAAALDTDGFALTSAGRADRSEEVAGALAVFLKRAGHDLAPKDSLRVCGAAFDSTECAVRVGNIEGCGLGVAVSVRGTNSPAIAHMLFDWAKAALDIRAEMTGRMCAAPTEKSAPAIRVRDSWFAPPRPAPQGEYVGLEGSNIFHLPSCRTLAKSSSKRMRWFSLRDNAVENGLTPCALCEP